MKKLEGAFTALVTPFLDGKLDEEGLRQNIRFQIAEGIDGIVALGCTGEASTLTHEEQRKVISIAVQEAKGKIEVIIGTGTNSTAQTIEKTKLARDLGADAVMVVTPYYNKPTQEGIYRHFEAVCTSVDIPVMIYNIPVRTVVNIETPTLLRIVALPTIVAVKESSGNICQMGDVIAQTATLPHFSVLSGDDAFTFPLMALGGSGIVSVVSNLVPGLVSKLVRATRKGQFTEAKALHYQLLPLYKAAFLETNPIPIKAAMDHCGMAAGECRLPLCQMNPTLFTQLQNVLNHMNPIHD